MSVINFPYNKQMPEQVTCELCTRVIPISEATLGPINAEGEVSLLCGGHLWDGRKFIDELADFMAGERRKFFRVNDHNLIQFGALPHVRTLH